MLVYMGGFNSHLFEVMLNTKAALIACTWDGAPSFNVHDVHMAAASCLLNVSTKCVAFSSLPAVCMLEFLSLYTVICTN